MFSLHHVPNKYNHAKLWEFEQKILLQLSEQQMATYSDLLWHFAPPFLRKALESGTQKEIMLQGWDTTARGVALPALSPRVCSQQCDRKTDCVAWVMTGKNKCYLESHMRIGMASTFGVTSGWRMDRFSKVWEDRSCRVSDSAP